MEKGEKTVGERDGGGPGTKRESERGESKVGKGREESRRGVGRQVEVEVTGLWNGRVMVEEEEAAAVADGGSGGGWGREKYRCGREGWWCRGRGVSN